MKPICVPCERFMRVEKNGYTFEEGMPFGNNRALPGKAEPEKWRPYKLWRGDLWKCPDCGAEVVVGVAQSPMAEHYQEDYPAYAAALKPAILVKDC